MEDPKKQSNNKYTNVVGFAIEKDGTFTEAFLQIDELATAFSFYQDNDLFGEPNKYTKDVACNITIVKMKNPKGKYTHCFIVAPEFRKLMSKGDDWEPESASQTSTSDMDNMI